MIAKNISLEGRRDDFPLRQFKAIGSLLFFFNGKMLLPHRHGKTKNKTTHIHVWLTLLQEWLVSENAGIPN